MNVSKRFMTEILRFAQNDSGNDSRNASGNGSPVIPVSYDNERLTPYSFEVTLSDGAINAKYALSHQSAIYSLKSDDPLTIILAARDGSVSWDGDALFGWQKVEGQTKVYVYMEALLLLLQEILRIRCPTVKSFMLPWLPGFRPG